jgi:hypothetical protein
MEPSIEGTHRVELIAPFGTIRTTYDSSRRMRSTKDPRTVAVGQNLVRQRSNGTPPKKWETPPEQGAAGTTLDWLWRSKPPTRGGTGLLWDKSIPEAGTPGKHRK